MLCKASAMHRSAYKRNGTAWHGSPRPRSSVGRGLHRYAKRRHSPATNCTECAAPAMYRAAAKQDNATPSGEAARHGYTPQSCGYELLSKAMQRHSTAVHSRARGMGVHGCEQRENRPVRHRLVRHCDGFAMKRATPPRHRLTRHSVGKASTWLAGLSRGNALQGEALETWSTGKRSRSMVTPSIALHRVGIALRGQAAAPPSAALK